MEDGGRFEDLPRTRRRTGDHRRPAQRREPHDRRAPGGDAEVPQRRSWTCCAIERRDRDARHGAAAPSAVVPGGASSSSTWHYQWIIVNEFLPRSSVRRWSTTSSGAGGGSTGRVPASRASRSSSRARRTASATAWCGRRTAPISPATTRGTPFFAFIFDPAGEGQTDPIDLRGGARAQRRFIGWQTFFDFGGDADGRRQAEQGHRHQDLDAAVQPAPGRDRQRRSRRRRCRSATCSGTSRGRSPPGSRSPGR